MNFRSLSLSIFVFSLGFTQCEAGPVVAVTTPQVTTASSAPSFSSIDPKKLKPDPFMDPLVQGVATRHEKAAGGDEAETKSLTTDLEKLTKDHPDNHVLQAFLGSTYTLKSRDAFPGPSKYTYLKNGLQTIEAAVTADGSNPGVRLVRAIDYLNLPAIFGRRATARDDFKQLLRWVKGEDKCDYQFQTTTAQTIYYYAGVCLVQESSDKEAKSVLEEGWKLDPSSTMADKIHSEIAKLDVAL